MLKKICTLVWLLLWLQGCASNKTATPASSALIILPTGDATRGEALFRQTLIGTANAPGCITCHSLAQNVVLVGPALAGVATRAAATIQQAEYTGQAQTVHDYLVEAIVAPNAYVVTNFAPDLMRPTFANELSAQEIADLAAFLSTLQE